MNHLSCDAEPEREEEERKREGEEGEREREREREREKDASKGERGLYTHIKLKAEVKSSIYPKLHKAAHTRTHTN